MQTLATVVGKTQNRTALGIVHAYMALNPNATLADLRRAFPNNLCPDSGVKELLLPLDEALAYNKESDMSLYFPKDAEIITLGNGSKICLSQIWSKSSLDKFVANAANLGIQASDPDKTLTYGPAGFKIDILQQPKKKSPVGVIVAAVVVVAAAAIAWFALRPSAEVKVEVDNEVEVEMEQVKEEAEEIEREFNAAQFEKGKAELTEPAKAALHELAEFLREHSELNLSIEGHTSLEGSDDLNQRLSEARAKAAYDYLVNVEGVDADRLDYTGYGSSMPISDNPEENRRIEFQVF